jgi:hypothetical protein
MNHKLALLEERRKMQGSPNFPLKKLQEIQAPTRKINGGGRRKREKEKREMRGEMREGGI